MDLPALDCWFLTGATAVGKSRVGMELAKRLNAEIISLDSMAIYRRMDIGTAKPSNEDCNALPHHMIDIREPTDEFSVAEYVSMSHDLIADIRSRGREVLFVGGTPLYLKSLLRGLGDIPKADWNFRKEVEEEIKRSGPEILYERVKQVDPLAAASLHPNDTRRLIRVLEVFKITGKPLSHQQMDFEEGHPAEECRVFTLQRERTELHARINNRVEEMFANGFLDEVQALTTNGQTLGRTASQAVGYHEVLEHLEGKLSLTEAIEQSKTRTRRFSKRQRTWYRSLSECQFVQLTEEDQPDAIADQIMQLANSK